MQHLLRATKGFDAPAGLSTMTDKYPLEFGEMSIQQQHILTNYGSLIVV